MFKARWILVLLAVAAGVGVYRLWRFDEGRSPRFFLDQAEVALDDIDPDYRTALRLLDRGLSMARAQADPDAVRDILLLRADVLRRNDASEQALEDYDELLAEHLPEDPDLLRLAARAAVQSGRPADAADYARRWTDRQPSNGGAWTELGLAELEQAEELLRGLHGRLDELLADESAARAARAADRVAYLPPGSPGRAAPLDRLLELCGPALLPGGLALLEEASARVGRARDAFVRSLEAAVNTRALSLVQLLYRRAGMREESALLGCYAMGVPGFRVREHLSGETTLALDSLGRQAAARELWRVVREERSIDVNIGSMAPDLAFPLGGTLARIGAAADLEALLPGLTYLRNKQGLPIDVGYYEGLALAGTGRAEQALRVLSGLEPGEGEPWPGAWRETLLARHALLQELGRSTAAPDRLLMREPGVRADPDLARVVGEAHLRQAEGEAARGDLGAALLSLARALELLGDRPDLSARWESWGSEDLRRSGRTVADLLRALARDSRTLELDAYSPYAVHAAARAAFEDGRRFLARDALGWLLRRYPDLPQALELDARLHAVAGEFGAAGRSWARKLELGDDPRASTLAALSALPWDTIPGEVRARLLRRAPEAFGPYLELRSLAAEGRVDEALERFASLDVERLGAGLRGEAARLFASRERWERALELLRGLDPGSPAALRSCGLLLLAAARAGAPIDPPLLDRVALGSGDDAELAAALDLLVTAGRAPAAREALERLLREERLRVPPLAERLLALSLVLDHDAAALPGLRAAVDEGAARLFLLLVAADGGDRGEIERAADGVALVPWGRAPLRAALLSALVGTPEDPRARLVALAGELDGEDEVLRRLALPLVGEAALPAEPGDDAPGLPALATYLLVCELALERPAYAAWVLPRLRELPDAYRTDPRVRLLEVLALERLGAGDEAERRCRALRDEGVEGAANLLEELVERRAGPEAPELEALRQARLDAGDPLAPGRRAFLEAARAERAGDSERALALLGESVRAGGPDAPRARRRRAALLERAGRHAEALADFHALLAALPPEGVSELIPDYLAAVDAAREAGALGDVGLAAYVEALAVQVPDDPLAVGRLARLAARDHGAEGLRRARRVLASYLAGGRRSVTAARPSEAPRWHALLRRYDADDAVAFARAELAALPERPSCWSELATSQAAGERFDEAYRTLEALTRMRPSPALLARLPRLAADAGRELDELPAGTRELDVARGLAAYDRAAPLAGAREALEAAWDARAGLERPALRRLGLAHAMALVQTRDAAEIQRARAVLQELLDGADDEAERQLYRSALGLTRRFG